MKLRALVIAFGLTVLAAAPAQAANPASGEVTTSQPSTTWSGSIDDFGAYDLAFWYFGTLSFACEQPFCDTFTLNVGPGANSLTIKVAGGSGTENIAFEAEDPDGELEYVDSEDTELRTTRERTFTAKPGEWVIRVSGTGTFDYTGTAKLTGGTSPAPSGGGGQQTAPPPSGGGQQPPAEQAPPPPPPSGDSGASTAPMPTVAVKSPSRKARSAKRLRKGRSLAVGVTTSAPLHDVSVALTPARGPRVLGSGRLASLAGSGTVKVKLGKSLKPGRYVLLVGGTDDQGRRVTAKRAFTVTR
ncbi:MAG TPA: hypothetical protein VF529_15995 [Solirubrobacteraceae bacterium]|jgi:hypothetical protein